MATLKYEDNKRESESLVFSPLLNMQKTLNDMRGCKSGIESHVRIELSIFFGLMLMPLTPIDTFIDILSVVS